MLGDCETAGSCTYSTKGKNILATTYCSDNNLQKSSRLEENIERTLRSEQPSSGIWRY
jgi:hypothetical protein